MSELSHRRARLLIQHQPLSPAERSQLAAHLVMCAECRRYAATHTYLSHNLQLEAVRTQPPPQLKAAILQQVQSQHRRNQIMNPIKTFAAVAVLAVVILVGWQIVRSSADQPAVSQPAAQPQAAATTAPTRTPRPTLTPLGTRVQEIVGQITTAEELAGVWTYSRGSLGDQYYQFNEDGTWRSAPIPDRLERAPGVTGEFWFEETRLNLVDIEDVSQGECEGVVGVYEVQLLESGAFTLTLIEDQCDGRPEQLAGRNFEPFDLTE